MGLSRLTTGHVAIIGVVTALLIGVAFFLLGPYKTNQNLTDLKTREEAARQQLNKKSANQKDLAKAKTEVAQTKAQFARFDRTIMPQPPIDLTKPQDETAMTKAMLRLWRQPYEITTVSNKFARDQARKYHVQLLSPPFSIAGQTTDPAAIPQSIIIFPMGTIQVAGSFQDVNNYMRSWNRFKRLVALDGFQLSTGPNPAASNGTVVGQATVTCYIFPHASEQSTALAAAGATSPYGGEGGYGPSGYGTGGYGTGAPGGPPGYPGPGGPGGPAGSGGPPGGPSRSGGA
jgi:Tfp pilus assembly protein PilO